MAEAKPAAAPVASPAPASGSPAPKDGLSEEELRKKVGKLWADDDPEEDSMLFVAIVKTQGDLPLGPAPSLLDKAKVTEAPEMPESEDVVIDQKNPNSPLYSVKSFSEMGLYVLVDPPLLTSPLDLSSCSRVYML